MPVKFTVVKIPLIALTGDKKNETPRHMLFDEDVSSICSCAYD